jgi:K+-transporting ATPase ATPase C chain
MRSELIASLRLVGVTIAICAVAYPLGALAIAAVVAPDARMGSLITHNGRVVGSRLVAQKFSRPEFFWPRPSAVRYDAAAAAGSNLSPANPLVRDRAEQIISRLDLPQGALVPVDLVTTSGSGLDPHISYAAAAAQAPRVAKAREMSENEVMRVINQVAEEIPLTTEGARIVNVLELNLALQSVPLRRSNL